MTRLWRCLPDKLSLLIFATLKVILLLYGIVIAVLCAPWSGQAHRDASQVRPERGDQRMVLEAERVWERALTMRDEAALDRLLAPEFVSRNTDGDVRGKRQYIAEVVQARYKLFFLKKNRIITRAGDDTYLVRGRLLVRVEFGGRTLTARFQFAHRFVRREFQWKAVDEEVKQIK